MKLIEVIFFIIVLMVVVVTVGKYYYPSQLVSAAGEAGQDTAKTYDFLKYKSEILWFEDKYNHTPSQERARSIPVLAYHGLAKQDYKSDVLVENFKKQMFMMKREGYQTITLEEFYEYRLGKRELPEKSFLLTFDDGIKSSYYGADPVLKALDYTAVMFLISKYSLGESDHPYYLSKSEVKKMLKTGRWEVQAHARDAHSLVQIDKAGAKANFFGNKMWLADEDRIETEEEYTARVSREFVNVRKDIEGNLSIPVYGFAVPFGEIGENSVNFQRAKDVVTQEAGKVYSLVFHQNWPSKGFTHNHVKNSTFIQRISIPHDWNTDELYWVLQDGKEKNLPFHDNFQYNTGWVSVWGERTIENNQMSMTSVDIPGAALFLDGSYLFQDYVFKTKVKEVKGEVISLRSRYQDELNYVACDYSTKYVRVSEMVKGVSRTVVEQKIGDTSLTEVELTMKVNGNKTECFLADKLVISWEGINPEFKRGGIGLKIWGLDPSTHAIIKEVSVEGNE